MVLLLWSYFNKDSLRAVQMADGIKCANETPELEALTILRGL